MVSLGGAFGGGFAGAVGHGDAHVDVGHFDAEHAAFDSHFGGGWHPFPASVHLGPYTPPIHIGPHYPPDSNYSWSNGEITATSRFQFTSSQTSSVLLAEYSEMGVKV